MNSKRLQEALDILVEYALEDIQAAPKNIREIERLLNNVCGMALNNVLCSEYVEQNNNGKFFIKSPIDIAKERIKEQEKRENERLKRMSIGGWNNRGV